MTFQFEVFPVVGPDDNPRANGKVFQLLRAVRETGSLHRAAKQVGLSYRHAWGVMRSWEEMLGRALLDMERGRGASSRFLVSACCAPRCACASSSIRHCIRP